MTDEQQLNETVPNKEEHDEQAPVQEKIASIMEAANALTALGDEESESGAAENPVEPAGEISEPVVPPSVDPPIAVKEEEEYALKEEDDTAASNMKRFLPEHKKPDAAPTFPEKMMALMRFADEFKADETYCAAWMPDGKSFVIRNPDEFARQVVPKYFKATKFSSFTRKLYRWGFRQINRGIGPDDMIIFGNEFFERDNEELMSKMRSITAAGARKTEIRGDPGYAKRPFDGMYDGQGGAGVGGPDQKRFIFDQIMHQNKGGNYMHPNSAFYGGMNHPNAGMPHVRGAGGVGMGMGMDPNVHHPNPHAHHHQQMMDMNKSYDMMQQGGPNPGMMNHQYNHMQQHHHYQQQQQQQLSPHLQHPQAMAPPMGGASGGSNSGNTNQSYNGSGQAQGYNGSGQNYNGNSQGYNANGPGYGVSGGGAGSAGGNQSTAEIVNAAIRALQFSS